MYTYQQAFHKISSWLNKFWFHSKMFKSGCSVDFAENALTPQWYTHIWQISTQQQDRIFWNLEGWIILINRELLYSFYAENMLFRIENWI